MKARQLARSAGDRVRLKNPGVIRAAAQASVTAVLPEPLRYWQMLGVDNPLS